MTEPAAGGALLRDLAESLFGAESAAAVAAALGVNRRTVLRWLNGQNAVPLEVWRELAGMLELRQIEIAELRRQVEAMLRGVD
jgi:plasmid maintenance system antidote protein VapI